MTKKRIYQFCFALPLLVPLIFLPLFPYIGSMNEIAAGIVIVVLYSGLIGGLPYLITVVPLLVWTRNQPESALKKALIVSPIMMLIPLGVLFAIYQIVTDPGVTIRDTFAMFVVFYTFFALCTLGFGYAYVGLAFALGSLFSSET